MITTNAIRSSGGNSPADHCPGTLLSTEYDRKASKRRDAHRPAPGTFRTCARLHQGTPGVPPTGEALRWNDGSATPSAFRSAAGVREDSGDRAWPAAGDV